MTLAEYVADKVKGHKSPLAYDLFSELAMFAIPKFKFVSNDEASKAIITELQKLGYEVGSQEATLHKKWPGQEHVVPFGKANPGGLYNPVSAQSFKIGDFVRVEKDTWRPAFEGIVERINGDLFDVRDLETRDVQEAIPRPLVKLPMAEGRPIAPPQHRRVGDPLGLMDSPSDVGGMNAVREYPGLFHVPRGEEGKSTSNPPDLFYSNLIDAIDAKHGKMSLLVAKYLQGEAINPSRDLLSILEAYGITRAV